MNREQTWAWWLILGEVVVFAIMAVCGFIR